MNAQQITILAGILIMTAGLALILLGNRARAGSPPEARDPDLAGTQEQEILDLQQPADLTTVETVAVPPAEAPAPPLVVLETRPFIPLVAAGHEATSVERRHCREHLGPELETDLSEVARLLKNRPAELRGLLINASDSVVSEELAVLRAYLRGVLTGLDTRLRDGPVQEPDEALAATMVSGLTRLPVHHGAVFHRAHRGNIELDAFFPGSILTEPGFTRTDRTVFPAAGTGSGPLVNYAIWSRTGRCTPLLVDHTQTVLFTAASRFRVLHLDRDTDRRDATVFLAEVPARSGDRAEREHQILELLRSRADAVGIGPLDGPSPAPVFHPGLNETGQPYAPSTGTAAIG